MTHFDGPAIVYDDVPEAIAGVQKGDVKPGHVLVLRGCGPKGGPAMAGSASRVVFAIYAAGLENEVAFVTRRTTLGAVQQRDDGGGGVAGVGRRRTAGARRERRPHSHRRRLAHTRSRRARLRNSPRVARGAASPRCQQSTGYLSIYQRSVQPMSTGAVLVTPEKR